MDNQNKNLIAALRYHDMGFSVIPVARNKQSLVAWQQYQNVKATREQIEEWFKQYPSANVGIVTGAISGIVVVDIDTTEKIDRPLTATVMSRTGRGGSHLFYKHPGRAVKTRAGIIPKVDIRGDGGIVVMPPSLHENGNHYEWILPPEENDFAELPQWVFEEEKNKKLERANWETFVESEVLEGARNQTATQIAGKLLHELPPKLWELGWFAMKEWNQSKGKPPLTEIELRNVWENIKEREYKKRAADSQESSGKFSAISLAELMNMEFQNPQWLVEKLIPHEAVTIISGAPGSYKTWLTLDIALKVATGGEKLFGEFQVVQSPVLIIDEEDHPRILRHRAKILSQNLDLPLFISSRKGFLLGKGSTEKVIQFAKDNNVRLVIFDSLIRIHDSDENVASEMRNVMKHLKDIANQGIAVIVIHHHRKKGSNRPNSSQDMRGSSDILALVDCHLAVERKGQETSVTIEQSKLREAQEMEPFVVHFQGDDSKGWFEYVGKSTRSQSVRNGVKTIIKEVLSKVDKPPIKTKLWKLVEQSGAEGGESTFKNVFKEMVKNDELFTKKGAKNTLYCSLNEFGADDS